MGVVLVLGCSVKWMEPPMCKLSLKSRYGLGLVKVKETNPNHSIAQGIDSNLSESTRLRRSRLGGIRIDSTFENELQGRTLSRKRVLKEHPCREISAHDDHMETPIIKIEQALWRNVASSGKYVL
ncbi:hypothetical protein PIB30_075415 [Stylosanthes scabra]|uniref:Uncharacterized protein n=1 Tax=Stylosanthes scabra TaxID=79078 RepID=A0ABU6VNE1_9FABA|nr:hypothetical protein [Stylosanthes scabra]